MLTDLADVLRGAGLTVVERPGWRTRGHGQMSGVRCVVLHHTAGPATGEAPSLGVVENGRPDLPGPLAQLVLGRSGTWYVVAAGLCHHTGATFEPWQRNTWAVGVEAEATGRDPWPPVQYSSYLRGARALADHYGVPHSRVLGHREIAAPLGRKTDPNFDLATFRAALTSQEDPMTTPAGVWATPIRNFNGDVVQAQQILVGIEARVADLQRQLAAARAEITALSAKVDGITPGPVTVNNPPVDLRALAATVADVLAERLRA
jgi:hypothetical protein